MIITSSRSIFDAHTTKENLEAIGWTDQHTKIRDQIENCPELLNKFWSMTLPATQLLLDEVNVTITSGDMVRAAWREAGLPIPVLMNDSPAYTMQAGDECLLMFDVKQLELHGEYAAELTIIHELKHYEQVKSGRMRMELNKYYWEGEFYASNTMVAKTMQGQGVFGNAFMQCTLPWELEAYQAVYTYAVDSGMTDSYAVMQKLPIEMGVALAKWRAGEEIMPSPFTYKEKILSREGIFGMGIADKEIVRNKLIEGLNDLVEAYDFPKDIIAEQTMLAVLNVDFEYVLSFMLGIGIRSPMKTGFFGKLKEDMPVSYFMPEVVSLIEALAAEGK